MNDLMQNQQESTLVGFATAMSTALVSSNEEARTLIQHDGCKRMSEKALRKIPLAAALQLDEDFCSVPSFSLTNHRPACGAPLNTKADIQQAAASSLGAPIEATQRTMHQLPSEIVKNISESFLSLVDSRFRSYITALADQATKDPITFSPILQMFATMATDLVSITTITSTFRIVENSTKSIQKNRLVSSLVQETMIDLDIGGEKVTVDFRGTGIIQGLFDDNSSLEQQQQFLLGTCIVIDTGLFLQNMATQARHVVKLATDKVSQLYLLSLQARFTKATNTTKTANQLIEEQQFRNENTSNPLSSKLESTSKTTALREQGSPEMPLGDSRCDQNTAPAPIYNSAKATTTTTGDGKRTSLLGIDLLTKAADTLGLSSTREDMSYQQLPAGAVHYGSQINSTEHTLSRGAFQV